MAFSKFQFAVSASHYCAWAYVIFQGVRLGMLRHYKVLFAYVAVTSISHTVSLYIGVRYGLDSAAYRSAYFFPTILISTLAITTLLHIYSLCSTGLALRRDWYLVAAFLFVAVLEASGESHHLGFRVLNVTLYFQAFLGGAAVVQLARHPEVVLGKNLCAALTALFAPAFVQSLNQAARSSELEIWPYDSFVYVISLTSLFSWLVLAFGMRSFDPPIYRQVPPVDTRRTKDLIIRLIKTIWRT